MNSKHTRSAQNNYGYISESCLFTNAEYSRQIGTINKENRKTD